MITRKEYMKNSRELHQKFYAQFLTEEAVKYVAENIGVSRILKSEDKHLNDIPLKEWDRLWLHNFIDPELWKKAHESNNMIMSSGEHTCLAKTAARVIQERGGL